MFISIYENQRHYYRFFSNFSRCFSAKCRKSPSAISIASSMTRACSWKNSLGSSPDKHHLMLSRSCSEVSTWSKKIAKCFTCVLVQAPIQNVRVDLEWGGHICPGGPQVLCDLPVLRKTLQNWWNVVGRRCRHSVASQLHAFHWSLDGLSIQSVFFTEETYEKNILCSPYHSSHGSRPHVVLCCQIRPGTLKVRLAHL